MADQQSLFQDVNIVGPIPLPVDIDRDSKKALQSLSSAIDEVKNSMNQINAKMSESVDSLSKIASSGMGGGGAAHQTAGPSGGGPKSGTPSSHIAQPPGGHGATPDDAGYGGSQGGGGMDDFGSPITPPAQSGRPSSGASRASVQGTPDYIQSSDWWSGKLAIPRINEFNVQDYARMTGKFFGSGPLKRYGERYDQAYSSTYDQAKADGADHYDAVRMASAQASSSAQDFSGARGLDRARLGIANTAQKFGALGPYIAATHQLMPQFLSGGYVKAPALGMRMGAGLGLQGQDPTMSGGTMDALKGGNLGANRFVGALLAGHGQGGLNPMDARAFGLFSPDERGAFAESSFQIGMRGNATGGEYGTALKSYANARTNARPAGSYDPGTYTEMFHEQTRYSDVGYKEAATNLDRLANSALNAGMSVEQLGQSAQAYYQANSGSMNYSQAVKTSTGYAQMGMAPQMGSDIVNSPIVQGEMAMKYGVSPYALPQGDPAKVMRASANVSKRMMSTFSSVHGSKELGITDQEAQTAAVAQAMGITYQEAEMSLKGNELAANKEAFDAMERGDSAGVKKSLSGAELKMGPDGAWSGFKENEINRITKGQVANKKYLENYAKQNGKDVDKLTLKERQEASYAETVAKNMDMDPNSQSFADYLEKQGGMSKEKIKAITGMTAGAQALNVEFTGPAGHWFQQHESDLNKTKAADAPDKSGKNNSP